MARNRKAKKRKGSRQQQNSQRNTMSTLSTEGRSSDGALSSDNPNSEQGTCTEMTSVVGSTEYGMTSVSGGLEVDDDLNSAMSDGQSTYAPPSEYPTMAQSHRSEMPYLTDREMEM